MQQMLIERHREYTLIYNAECDSLNPKSGLSVIYADIFCCSCCR